MLKTVGLVGILCALAIAGMMWTRQSFQTSEKAPSAILLAAGTAIEFTHKSTGTYLGRSPEGVTLVWADQFRYCLERDGWFLSGPGGQPAAGACPR